jgi:hypothetical protein
VAPKKIGEPFDSSLLKEIKLRLAFMATLYTKPFNAWRGIYDAQGQVTSRFALWRIV